MTGDSLITRVISRQPFKALFVLASVVINLIKLPFWMLYFLPRPLRQHPGFTYRQSIRVEIVRNYLRVCSAIRLWTPMQLKPGRGVRDPARYLALEPSRDATSAPEGTRYTGILNSTVAIRPVSVFGIWYPKAPSTAELAAIRNQARSKPLVLHFHGGAYAIGDPRPAYCGYMGNMLSEYLGPTICASYRLGSNPNGAFPAALQDAVTAYAHVLNELHIPPSRVVLAGDSAGGNLVVALLRYLARYPEAGLPAPGAAILLSPWVSVAAALDPNGVSSSPHAASDYITPNFGQWGAGSILPAQTGPETAADGPWLSPLGHPFATPTPVWVQTGGAEVLCEPITDFAEQMRGIKGNEVGFYVEPTANHDVVLVGNVEGFETEAKNIMVAAAKWFKSVRTA